MSDKFEPFASDREKRLAWFAQEVLQEASDACGDLDYMTVINVAERAGLIHWIECTPDNVDEWPGDCEQGDPMWQQKRGQLPAGVITLEQEPK